MIVNDGRTHAPISISLLAVCIALISDDFPQLGTPTTCMFAAYKICLMSSRHLAWLKMLRMQSADRYAGCTNRFCSFPG